MTRFCVDCKADISSRGSRSVRCTDCQQKHRHKSEAARQKNTYYRQNPEAVKKKRRRDKNNPCIGTEKPRLGEVKKKDLDKIITNKTGESRFENYLKKLGPTNEDGQWPTQRNHLWVPRWGRVWIDGETVKDKHTKTLENTLYDEEDPSSIKMITKTNEGVYINELRPERVKEIEARFTVFESAKETIQQEKKKKQIVSA